MNGRCPGKLGRSMLRPCMAGLKLTPGGPFEAWDEQALHLHGHGGAERISRD